MTDTATARAQAKDLKAAVETLNHAVDNTEALKAAIQALNHAVDNADVTGYDGEAVLYLDALLMMADGLDADAAVAQAYGIKA